MPDEEDADLDAQIMADRGQYDAPQTEPPAPKKPSFIDSAKERIGEIGSKVKENIDAKRAEARQLEAEKKAARDEAKLVRKAMERKETISKEYEKELNRKSIGQQLSNLAERIPKPNLRAAAPVNRFRAEPQRSQMPQSMPTLPNMMASSPATNMMQGSPMTNLLGGTPKAARHPPRRTLRAKSVDLFRSGSSKMPDLFGAASGRKGMPSFGFSKGKKQKGFKLL
jgi:hypothetical protein